MSDEMLAALGRTLRRIDDCERFGKLSAVPEAYATARVRHVRRAIGICRAIIAEDDVLRVDAQTVDTGAMVVKGLSSYLDKLGKTSDTDGTVEP